MATEKGLVMTNTACPIERSGSGLSGGDCVGLGTVNDRIVFSRDRVHRHLAGSVSLPAPEFKATDGSRRCEPDCHVFGNAIRGWVYALVPSAVLWAILIGVIYSLLK